MSTSTTKYFLGVDGGASKTAALVIDEEGQALGRGVAGPSNHLRVGIETATRNIERAVNIALVEAGMAIRQVEYAYCGIAGADHPAHRQRVIDSLRIFFPRGNFIVDNDARPALTGAIGFGSGIVIISGTGSVAFGRNESGQEARAGGWGPTIGDEGSGYAIARDGLSAIVPKWFARRSSLKWARSCGSLGFAAEPDRDSRGVDGLTFCSSPGTRWIAEVPVADLAVLTRLRHAPVTDTSRGVDDPHVRRGGPV